MPDPEPQTPIVNKTGSAIFTTVVFCFSVWIIVYIILWGEVNNGHHATALGWAFTLIVVCLGAVGLAPIIAQLLPLVRK